MAVAFARFLGVIVPAVSPTAWIVPPIRVSAKYAVSLSWQQLVGILLILALTAANTRGLRLGKWIQNVFTSAKTVALVALIVLGVFVGRNAAAMHANFSHLWAIHDAQIIHPGADFLRSWVPSLTAAAGAAGLLVAFGVAQVGSLFSADAWNNITFTAGEVKNPRRDVPLSLALGTVIVITLYLLANVAYLLTLPLAQIQSAPDDRVATADAQRHFWKCRGRHHGRRHHDLHLRLREWLDSGRRARLLRHGSRRPILPVDRHDSTNTACPQRDWCCRASGRPCWCWRAPAWSIPPPEPLPTAICTATCSITWYLPR